MSGSEQFACSRCETLMDTTTVVCPVCGVPRATGSEKKREQVRLIIAIVASVGIILLWQWWRGPA